MRLIQPEAWVPKENPTYAQDFIPATPEGITPKQIPTNSPGIMPPGVGATVPIENQITPFQIKAAQITPQAVTPLNTASGTPPASLPGWVIPAAVLTFLYLLTRKD
jgi:hypothetical protein